MRLLIAATAALAAGVTLVPAAPIPASTFFDGKTLAGWVNVNCAPDTFRVEHGEIVTNGKPTGFLRTAKQYENFKLSFDWLHTNTKEVGNSGLFVWGDALPAVGTGYTRGIEVQVLVNLNVKDTYTSHGDLFSIWGATCTPARPHPKGWERCLPSENRCKGGGEWNHYDVVGDNGTITLAVNGKVVSEVKDCKPRKGYLALESEGAECHFKNFAFEELPTTNPAPDEVATADDGFMSLYTGVGLAGWTADAKDWKAGEVLKCVGKTPLATGKALGAGTLRFDFKGRNGNRLIDDGQLSWCTGDVGWMRQESGLTGVTPTVFEAVDGLELRNIFFKPAKK